MRLKGAGEECVKINERGGKHRGRGGGEEGRRRDQRSVREVRMERWEEHGRVRSYKSVTAAASLVY